MSKPPNSRQRTSTVNSCVEKKRRILRRTCIAFATGALCAPASSAAAPDPLLAQQWALADPSAVGARDAWARASGAGVLVAVLDSGVQVDHPDLAANVWTNPDENANGRDDDANGIVDDIHGASMFDGSANVIDDNGHGTHVAGIVAALRDNAIGGSGLAPDAKILPVKVLDATKQGDTDGLARGIRYAVDEGARILNVSVNGDGESASLAAAVRYAGERGAIIVASAGNNGRDLDLLASYPASLPDPAVVSVAAATEEGGLWEQSNTGAASVDLAAPGTSITSTAPGSGYQARVGTSAAAPFVSAALALLASARPDLPMSALRDAILSSARRSASFRSLSAGGRLDVGAAMRRILPAERLGARSGGAKLRLRTSRTARAGSRVSLRWSTTAAEHVAQWRISLDGRVVARLPGQRAGVARRIVRSGRHSWRVVGFDADGAKVVAARRAFRLTRGR